MPMPVAVPSSVRCALLAAALLAVPTLTSAQGRANAGSRVESVVVTAPSVRVRTAPSISSLSIDEFREGSVFPVASEEYQSKDWLGIVLDGRVAYLPRYAVAARLRPASVAPANETRMVAQAGAPAPVQPAQTPAPAPVIVATRPMPVETAAPPAAAPAPVPVAVAPVRSSPIVPPVVAERAPERAPEPVAERVAVTEPARKAEPAAVPAAEPKKEQPPFSVRRTGMNLTIGVLGSVTPIKTNGLTPTAHVAGVSFFGAQYRFLGAYVAPEYGQGGGYRSTMLGAGLSLDLLRLHMLRVTALGGIANYSETSMPADTTSIPVTRSLKGTSVGGMVSIPFFGPLRLAYRGQYVMAHDTGIPVQMTRHSVGLVF
jgi:hypothetical protein